MNCVIFTVVEFLLITISTSSIELPVLEYELMGAVSEYEDFNMNFNDVTLIFANVIFRHGDRNIDKVFPNDPYRDEKHWPEGFGQLTKEGKQRQYKLGQYLRRRYDKLLGGKYMPNKVYVQSSDYDRTLMSAQTCLAGLFPPIDEEKWNDTILWQPIPVHTMPRKTDMVIAIEKPCPKYDELRAKYEKESKELQRIYTEHADDFAYWSMMSGANITATYDVYWLHNTLKIEQEQNKKLSKWAEDAIKPGGIMEYIANFDFTLYSSTPQLAKFASGFLFKQILKHFSQKINSTLKPDRSLWIYSGHDYTIANALNSMGLYKEVHIPPYSSSLHIELYRTSENMHYVQVFYRRSEEEYPLALNIPGCGEKCPIEQFYALFREMIPRDADSECRI